MLQGSDKVRKDEKNFHFITKLLFLCCLFHSSVFFLSDVVARTTNVVCRLSSVVCLLFRPQIIHYSVAHEILQNSLKNTTTTRVVSKDRKYHHHVANVREFTFFFFFFIYIFIIFEFEKMQKSIFVVVTDKNSS